MRRSLLAVPVVLALGAGGYLIFHAGSPATTAPHPATTVRTRDGRVIDLATVHSGVAAAPQPAGSAGSSATVPVATAGSAASSTTATAVAPADRATGSATNAAGGVPPVMPAGDVARFEATHGPAGTTKPLPMPVPGTQGLQKRLGAMANCQGPEYATLTGQARVAYAKRCAKAGVTLPP